MRRAARTDANHAEIIAAFRAIGFVVSDTSRLGNGFPDAIISRSMKTAVVEIKDGNKPPSARKLTADEQRFKDAWAGVHLIVESLDDVERIGREWTRIEVRA